MRCVATQSKNVQPDYCPFSKPGPGLQSSTPGRRAARRPRTWASQSADLVLGPGPRYVAALGQAVPQLVSVSSPTRWLPRSERGPGEVTQDGVLARCPVGTQGLRTPVPLCLYVRNS